MQRHQAENYGNSTEPNANEHLDEDNGNIEMNTVSFMPILILAYCTIV